MEIDSLPHAILGAIAKIQASAPTVEVPDTAIADHLDVDLRTLRDILDDMAQRGQIYIKRGIEPGYWVWPSARGAMGLGEDVGDRSDTRPHQGP